MDSLSVPTSIFYGRKKRQEQIHGYVPLYLHFFFPSRFYPYPSALHPVLFRHVPILLCSSITLSFPHPLPPSPHPLAPHSSPPLSIALGSAQHFTWIIADNQPKRRRTRIPTSTPLPPSHQLNMAKSTPKPIPCIFQCPPRSRSRISR
jgi:hypothetical protein